MYIGKACQVRFENKNSYGRASYSKLYSYGVPKGVEVKEGDLVVVEANGDYETGAPGFSLAYVTNTDTEVTAAKKWVVCVVDKAAHEARKEHEVKVRVLRSKLEARAKVVAERERFAMLADDEEGKALLDELKSLEV